MFCAMILPAYYTMFTINYSALAFYLVFLSCFIKKAIW
ncbi:hypothetical protein A1OE_1192 [Candidatus Endolissoclinum faulkneri L2]|uniref:Uncharacterized protein n=1 Tax=Candidatus Endolissoclinum faulkneri L2 TaxID=1193729 RepID=K7Z5M8_9PROT|nr:hypothetical protein A1OE_1192 [Candidatus Endolissoclinum faulkneri L2]